MNNSETAITTVPETSSATRLPLWRSVAEKMLARGVAHGDEFSHEFFEEQLCESRYTFAFSVYVSNIRRVLERKIGGYLTERGTKGKGFVVLPPAKNADVMASYGRKAADCLRRGVILGTATPVSVLSEEDRRRHEAVLERMAIKSALIQRSAQVAKVISKNKPALLDTPKNP